MAAWALWVIVNCPLPTAETYTPVEAAALADSACKKGTLKAEQFLATTTVDVAGETSRAIVPTALDRPVANSLMAEEMRVGSFS
jgi:hypothetical protein